MAKRPVKEKVRAVIPTFRLPTGEVPAVREVKKAWQETKAEAVVEAGRKLSLEQERMTEMLANAETRAVTEPSKRVKITNAVRTFIRSPRFKTILTYAAVAGAAYVAGKYRGRKAAEEAGRPKKFNKRRLIIPAALISLALWKGVPPLIAMKEARDERLLQETHEIAVTLGELHTAVAESDISSGLNYDSPMSHYHLNNAVNKLQQSGLSHSEQIAAIKKATEAVKKGVNPATLLEGISEAGN